MKGIRKGIIDMDASPNPISALADLRLIAARLQLDFGIPSSELPDMAVSALEAGVDSPSLRLLAGESHPTWAECGPLFRCALQELGITPLSRTEAAHVLLRHAAERILNASMSPYEGACEISDVARCFWGEELWQRLSIFIGLASEWQDDPDRRLIYEQGIREKARELFDELS